MDLAYDEAHLEQTEQEVSVRFARKRGEGEDIVFKTTASLEGIAVTPGTPIDLAGLTTAGTVRGVTSRNVLDDPRRTFPTIVRGRLLFQTAFTSGAKAAGEFSVTYENGIELASGRTVFGNFEALVP
jgi:hypothetical protein